MNQLSNHPHAQVSVAMRTVGSYERYGEAEQAMNRLAERDFPIERAMIVGRDLEVVERVTGTITAAVATGRGALFGLVIGALTGWLIGLLNLVDPLVAAFWLAVNTALLGAILGAATSMLVYAATKGRRSFTSITGTRARHYDILVDAEVADRAAGLLTAEGSAPENQTQDEPSGHTPHQAVA